MSCWIGSFSFDLCCSGAWGVGLTSCWDDAFNWETCCVPEMQQILIDKGFDPHDVQDPERLRSLTASEGVQGRGAWQQDMAECIDTYDKTENYRFYRRHSGMLGHDIAHVGNPDVCTAGGHNFYWGYVVFRLPHGQPPRDLALEFSLCVPRACSFSVVETIFVPYTLGRYLGRNWGPQTPEIMTRWQVDAMAEEVAKEDTVRYFVYQVVALHARGPAGWYEQEWPYRQQVWQYQPSWWPSPTSCAVLAALAAPPLVAGICLQLVKRSGSSFCLSGLRTFAPQSHIYDLWVTRSDGELPQLHTLRVVLQLLVCWQHAVLLVDWLGNSGFAGIEGFLPITSQVAKVLARVNNTFACLSLVLSMRSMQRTLGAVRSAGGGIVQSVLAALVWMMRRWLRQACELGFWMFFYLVLAREIPWKPFPDFTFIWYKDRLNMCSAAPLRHTSLLPKEVAAYFPMWLLSLLFVYAPVNQALNLYQPVVSVCHNMQIFESLFAISVAGAGVGFMRHFSGNAGAVCTGVLLTAFCLWWEPELLREGFREGRRFVWLTTAEMLPGALLCAWLLEARCLPGHGAWWGLALTVAAVLVDWLSLPNTEVVVDATPTAVADMVFSKRKITGFFLANGLHAIAMALVLRDWELSEGKAAAAPSGWVRAMSRLSLGVNLTNIFSIHYLRGRLLLMPIEFHHIHVLAYTLWAWVSAGLVSVIVHCCVMPYALLGDAALRQFAGAERKAKKP